MRSRVLFVVGAAILVASPLLAGEKCTESTQVCLDHLSQYTKDRGWVGIEYDKHEATGGFVVTKIAEDSPAQAAGLQIGDILVAMNGIKTGTQSEEAKAAYKNMKQGNKVTYTVQRGDYEKKVDVTLGKMPEEIVFRIVGSHMLEHVTADQASAEEE